MTKLGFLNMFIFQFFFIRLTKHLKKDSTGNYTLLDKYSFQYWVVPFTGWNTSFKYLNKSPKFLFI